MNQFTNIGELAWTLPGDKKCNILSRQSQKTLVDRNFFPKEVIMKIIDGMAMVKLNVLHWHFSDTQSFSMRLPNLPLLAEFGAYNEDIIYEVRPSKLLNYY